MSTHEKPRAGGPRPVKAPRRREEPKQFRWKATAIAAAALALVGASFVVPGLFEREPATQSAGGHQMASGEGDGPDVGSRITFAERDAVDGRELSSQSLRGRKTLLFFSEGVMFQACFEQIRDIEDVGAELEKRGIGLVSITPDSEQVLREAVSQYGISTPMISDENRDMSAAFDTLGRGMHSDTPGHGFVLVDETGTVVWQRDYWLDPYRTMYVEPETLLAAGDDGGLELRGIRDHLQRHTDDVRVLLELVDRGDAERVERDQADVAPLVDPRPGRELGDRRRLADAGRPDESQDAPRRRQKADRPPHRKLLGDQP